MRSWSVFGSYQINRNSAIRLAFEKQKLSTADFALDNVESPSNALLLGETAPNYDLSLLMLTYSYQY
jgi:hypothetical protein